MGETEGALPFATGTAAGSGAAAETAAGGATAAAVSSATTGRGGAAGAFGDRIWLIPPMSAGPAGMMMDAPSRSGIGGIDEDFVLRPRTFLLALGTSGCRPVRQAGYHSDEERKEAQPFPGLLFGFFGAIAEHQLLQGVLCREALDDSLVAG